jgi:hypothetical protein
MHGGLGQNIARRSGAPDYTPSPAPNWTDIDGGTLNSCVTTQQIRGINRTVALSAVAAYGMNALYYRVDPSSSSFNASGMGNAGSGWTQFTSNVDPTNINVKNGEWLSFGTPYFTGQCPVDTTVNVANVSTANSAVDAFNYRYWVFDCGSSPPLP